MRRFIIIVLTLLGGMNGTAQVTFEARAPKVMEVGEQFKVAYVLNKRVESLNIPEMEGCSMLHGPSIGTSSSYSNINGKVVTVSEYSHTYLFVAEKEGKFTLAPATVVIDGKEYKSNSLTITVVPTDPNRAVTTPRSSRQSSPQQQQGTNVINEENLFLRFELRRHSLYAGEGVEAVLKVYTRLNIGGFGRSKFPAFDGMLAEDVPMPKIEVEREEYNGKVYDAAVLRRWVLFPQHTGEITIDPFEVECNIIQRERGGDPFFDAVFGNTRAVSATIRSKSVKMTVNPLPLKDKPTGFSGVVGNITLSESLSSDTVRANDALTYRVTFRGSGNLKMLAAPKINFPVDFEVYDPKVSRNVRTERGTTTGSVTFEYLLIPRFAGDYTLPAVNYSFFDLQSKSYRMLTGKPHPVHVLKGNEVATVAGEAVAQSFKKEDLRVLGEDIRFIKTGENNLQPKGVRYFRTWIYVWSLTIPFVFCVVGMWLNRRRIKANADLVKVKSKRASKMAQKRLKIAAGAMQSGDSGRFYQEVLTALWGYVSYKLNIPASELNRDNISEHLTRRGVTEGALRSFMEVLDQCEYVRYAPDSDREQGMDTFYRESMAVIMQLDKMI